jgi:DNA-binding NarL/FixJ family response regulator
MIQVLLIEPWPVIQLALQTLLAPVPDLEFLTYPVEPSTLRVLSHQVEPVVVMTTLESLELLTPYRGMLNTLLVVENHKATTMDVQALLATNSVQGILDLDAPIEEWLMAIRTVGCGGTWLSQHSLGQLLHQTQQETLDLSELSPRETEVLSLAASGSANKVIAQQLEISERTVEYHFKNVRQKLGVSTRLEAILHFTLQSGSIDQNT